MLTRLFNRHHSIAVLLFVVYLLSTVFTSLSVLHNHVSARTYTDDGITVDITNIRINSNSSFSFDINHISGSLYTDQSFNLTFERRTEGALNTGDSFFANGAGRDTNQEPFGLCKTNDGVLGFESDRGTISYFSFATDEPDRALFTDNELRGVFLRIPSTSGGCEEINIPHEQFIQQAIDDAQDNGGIQDVRFVMDASFSIINDEGDTGNDRQFGLQNNPNFTIIDSDGNTLNFGDAIYVEVNGGSCPSLLVINQSDLSLGTVPATFVNRGGGSCATESTSTENISNPNASNYTPGQDIADPDAFLLEGLDTGPSCESEGGEFSFLVCPALRFVNGAFSTLDAWIIRSLDFEQAYFEEDGQSIRRAWQNIRNIAYIILIPVMLIMVIGTAIGTQAIDPYTVKRALPRMLAAVIFMALSYDITRILILISDEVGRGTAGLIAQPFGGLDNLELTDIFGPSTAEGATLTAAGIGLVFAAGATGYITIGILLSFLAVGAVTLLVIFLLLTIRELLIVFLVVISPLAILTWIFRGNDGSWKLWWGTFWKLLMVFPVVMGFLVLGRAFASLVAVAEANEGGTDFFITIVKLIAFIGPYFAIPSAFRFLGGAFANIAGIANDRSRGFFDRNRKFRENTRKNATERAKHGNRFKGNGHLTERLNRGSQFLANANHALDGGILGGNYGQNIRNKINNDEHAHAAKVKEENPYYASFEKDDTVLGAALESRTADQLRGALIASGDQRFQDENVLNATVQNVMAAKRMSGEGAFNRAAIQSLASDGTYFRDAAHLAETVNRVYGSDRQNAGSALMAASSASMQAGRIDLGGASAGAKLSSLQGLYDGTMTAADVNDLVHRNVVDSQPASNLFHPSMKDGFVADNLIPQIQRRITEAYATGDQTIIDKELATIANTYEFMAQTNPKLANLFADQVLGNQHLEVDPRNVATDAAGAELNVRGPHISEFTIRQRIEQARSRPDFLERRKEWSTREEQDANAAGGGQQPPGGGAGDPPGPQIGGMGIGGG